MTSNKYPKTLEEAFEIMDALLTDEDKRDALKTQDDERYASDQHFGLGLWVRNNWIYEGKVERAVLTGAEVELESEQTVPEALLFGMSPDDLSSRFVSLYHRHLRETYK